MPLTRITVRSSTILDATIAAVDIADDAVTADKLANSINTDIATGVTGNTTANAALPKAGGAMTGTITGFTSTGVDDNATSNAITINSGENVGIGTSSPSAKIHATTATAGYTAKLINTNGASDANGLLIQAGTAASEYALNVTNTAGSTNFMVVKGDGKVGIGTTSPSSKLTSESAGATNIVAKSTNGNGGYMNFQGLGSDGTQTFGVNHNGTIFTTSGLAVGGTSAANTLDDYEKGTWTPVGTAFTIGTIHQATYHKIGDAVIIQAYVDCSSGTGSSAWISGLPFSTAHNGYATGVINMTASNSTVTNPHVRCVSDQAKVQLIRNNDTGLIGTEVDAGHFIFSVTYFTT